MRKSLCEPTPRRQITTRVLEFAMLVALFACQLQALYANPLLKWGVELVGPGYKGIHWLAGAEAAAFARAGDTVVSHPAGITEKNIATETFPKLKKRSVTMQHARAPVSSRTSTNTLTMDAISTWDQISYSGTVTTDNFRWDDRGEFLYGWGYAKGGGETVFRCRDETTCASEQVETVEVRISIPELQLEYPEGGLGSAIDIAAEAYFEDLASGETVRTPIFTAKARLFGFTTESLQIEGDISDQILIEVVSENGTAKVSLQRPIIFIKKIRVPFRITREGVRTRITTKSTLKYRMGKARGV